MVSNASKKAIRIQTTKMSFYQIAKIAGRTFMNFQC